MMINVYNSKTKNGILIRFKYDERMISRLKKVGFSWRGSNKCWYIKKSDRSLKMLNDLSKYNTLVYESDELEKEIVGNNTKQVIFETFHDEEEYIITGSIVSYLRLSYESDKIDKATFSLLCQSGLRRITTESDLNFYGFEIDDDYENTVDRLKNILVKNGYKAEIIR